MVDLSHFELTANIIVIVVSIVLYGFVLVTMSALKSHYPDKFQNGWLNFFIFAGEFALGGIVCIIIFQMFVPEVSYKSTEKIIEVVNVETTADRKYVIEEKLGNGSTRKVIFPKVDLTTILSDDEKYHLKEEKPVKIKKYKIFNYTAIVDEEDMDTRYVLERPRETL